MTVEKVEGGRMAGMVVLIYGGAVSLAEVARMISSRRLFI
jgi:hypothetical protein